jgi:hypothetical protein
MPLDWKSLTGLLGDLTLAPARAYMAEAPKAPLSMGLLGDIHNAIDPVNAFGGYGGLAAMALPPGAPRGSMVKTGHARIGGETAESNGYFYKGGQFLPSTDLPPGSFRVGKKIVKAKKMEIEPYKWEAQPTAESTAIWPHATAYATPGTAQKGHLTFWQGRAFKDASGNPITAESKAIGDLTYGDLIEMYNKGMRWVERSKKP